MSTKTNTHSLHIVVAVVVVCCLAGAAGAQSWWTGAGGDSDWFNALNWDTGVVPVENECIYVDDAAVTAERAVVVDGMGSISTMAAELSFRDLTVGRTGLGDCYVDRDSAIVTDNLTLGEFEGSEGLFDGTFWEAPESGGSAHLNEFLLTVGASGEGMLNTAAVTESGAIAVGLFHRSQGDIFSGGETTIGEDLTVGAFGSGYVTVTAGGTLTCREAMLGMVNVENSLGEVIVEQGASMTVSDHLTVGYSGRGSLEVAGTLTTGSALLGGQMGEDMEVGSGIVNVIDEGQWTCTDALFIGEQGEATVSALNGASIATGDCYIGWADTENAIGYAEAFSGAQWHSTNMFVGVYGRGQLDIGPESEVVVDDRLYIAQKLFSNGECKLYGGRLTAGSVYVGHDMGVGLDSDDSLGVLDFAHSASVVEVSNLFRIGCRSSITAVQGAALILGGASLENESTNPADIAGLANMEVIVRSPAGEVVAIEAGSKNEGRGVKGRPHLNSFGILYLEAGANVRLTDNIDNVIDSDRADVVYVDELILSPGATLDLAGVRLYCTTLTDLGGVVTGGEVTVTEISGDVNCDGVVDLNDFVIFKTNFGTGNRWQDGDLDEDGDVDLTDFVILKSNFGASAG